MLKNYLAAALRNLVRNRLYFAINLVCLAVGFAAALLIASFVRRELTYDMWVPAHERVYLLSAKVQISGRSMDMALAHMTAWLKEGASSLEAIGRLAGPGYGTPAMPVQNGDVEGLEKDFYWADADFFHVVKIPAFAGDPVVALQRPDGVVLTRSAARRYFGQDAPIGQTLVLNGQHAMTVGAVIEDLPDNSHFAIQILASGRAPFSELAKFDASANAGFGGAYTYVLLKEGASREEFSARTADILERNLPQANKPYQITPVALADIHFSTDAVGAVKPRGDQTFVTGMMFAGVLIAAITTLNFVSLVTACAGERAQEVGVRKVCGASRGNVGFQFLAEIGTVVLIGFGLAAILSALAAQWLGEQTASSSVTKLRMLEWPMQLAAIALFIALLAAAYPALVLSAFRPAKAMRVSGSRVGSAIRTLLVILQFGILTALVIAAVTMHRQMDFAAARTLTLDKDQILLVDTACTGSFPQEVRRLAGVQGAHCSESLLSGQDLALTAVSPDGTRIALSLIFVEPGLFELFGITPTAGRPLQATDTATGILMNQAAVRQLGFLSDEDILERPAAGEQWGRVVGVVPDVITRSVRDPIRPTVYSLGTRQRAARFSLLNIKLSGHEIPQTLQAIDVLWRKTGDRAGPISRRFFDQYVQSLYSTTTRQMTLFNVIAAAAIFVAALGLFGLSAFAAEQHTKEIGVRKAMGATRSDILRLILWRFAKPVLWANLIGWPAAYFVMRRWLDGFAYRVDLEPSVFVAASAVVLLIALTTVLSHVLLVTRAHPVTALRYE